MSSELGQRIHVGLEELEIVRKQFDSLLSMDPGADLGVIETSAACAMLHSFYTEVEKILKVIAREWDKSVPASEAWHRDLLLQMSAATDSRPPVLSPDLLVTLKEFLAFRHLFRGASIALMRWGKLYPLVMKVNQTHLQVDRELRTFSEFIEAET